jgi:YVTN family beta-propeller protein
MKKVVFLLSMVFLLNACYQDDIDELNRKYDELKKEQERQAELLATYQTLLDALNKKLTVNSIVTTDDGYKITFSDGREIVIGNGHTPVITIGDNGNWFIDGADTGKPSTGRDGTTPQLTITDGYWQIDGVNTGVKAEGADGQDAPAIISIVELNGIVIFYMSDGTSITMPKLEIFGLYVLSEGSWGQGDGQLAYFDYNVSTGKYVRNDAKRFRNYGETPNDLLLYGSKIYCAITGYDIIRVIDASTGEKIEDISWGLIGTHSGLLPRRLTALNGKVYATLYSGSAETGKHWSELAQVDTATYDTELIRLSGSYPEGICSSGKYLYICNSGQGADNTISVVDTETFTETETITVPYNPVNIVNADNNELYVNTASIWTGAAAGTPANLHVLNTTTKQITHTFDLAVESIAAGKDYIYGAATDWSDYSGILKKISVADRSVSDFTTAASKLMFAYKVSVNDVTDEIFLTQQMGQDVNRFKADGTHIETLKTGQQNGSAVVFLNRVK